MPLSESMPGLGCQLGFCTSIAGHSLGRLSVAEAPRRPAKRRAIVGVDSSMNIRPMRQDDAQAVLAIYSEGIVDRLATFETVCPSWEDWNANHLEECRLVAESDGTVLGWGALSAVSRRACYRGVAEVSVYVRREARGQGVGLALLEALVEASERAGFWTLQSAVFEENESSLRVQERCGFRVVGCRERIGQLDGRWKSTLLTERRSPVVGVDRPDAEPRPRRPGNAENVIAR
jgi:L-amino acid N-acyltransferase YncA